MDSDSDGILIIAWEDSYSSSPGADTLGTTGTVAESASAVTGIHCIGIGIAGTGSGSGIDTGIGTGIGTCPRPTVSPGDNRERCI